MLEVSRFFGIIVRLFVEVGGPHRAHFHAYYKGTDDLRNRSHRPDRGDAPAAPEAPGRGVGGGATSPEPV